MILHADIFIHIRLERKTIFIQNTDFHNRYTDVDMLHCLIVSIFVEFSSIPPMNTICICEIYIQNDLEIK